MKIFKCLRTYPGRWKVKCARPLTSEEIALVDKAVVVKSDIWLSVCFYMKNDLPESYIYLDPNCSGKVHEGDVLNLDEIEVLILELKDNPDICRIRVKA